MKNNFGINDKSFEEMISLFKSFDNLDVVYIFGSRARGDYKTASDIDLAIETSDDIKLRLLGMLEEIRCILKFDVVDINNIGNEITSNEVDILMSDFLTYDIIEAKEAKLIKVATSDNVLQLDKDIKDSVRARIFKNMLLNLS